MQDIRVKNSNSKDIFMVATGLGGMHNVEMNKPVLAIEVLGTIKWSNVFSLFSQYLIYLTY